MQSIVSRRDFRKLKNAVFVGCRAKALPSARDRKSTRLNSSHSQISYAVFCLKKKKINPIYNSCDSEPISCSKRKTDVTSISPIPRTVIRYSIERQLNNPLDLRLQTVSNTSTTDTMS